MGMGLHMPMCISHSPVAWNVMTSYSPSSALRTASQQGVVTPNMLMPSAGFEGTDETGGRQRAIPLIAAAALDRMAVEMGLMPATSTIEGIIIMSVHPTYGSTFPLAIVLTITFGSPTGSACKFFGERTR